MAVEDSSSFSSMLCNDQAALTPKELVVGKKGDPPPGGLGGWKTDGAPTSSVHLEDLLLPVFKHHLAPCLSRKNVHRAYALSADCLVSIWQLRGVCFSPLTTDGTHSLWIPPACEREEVCTRNWVYFLHILVVTVPLLIICMTVLMLCCFCDTMERDGMVE